ncbi:MAG TPA: hypothetical protein VII34_01260 [Pyrinomonadaceae bacterium]
MPDAYQLSDPLFEFPDISAFVSKPPAVKNVVEPVGENLPIANVRSAHMQDVVKGGLPAEECQVVCLNF